MTLMPDSDPSVAIVDGNAVRAAILEQGLREAGVTRVTIIPETSRLLARLVELEPDVIVIDLESPSRDALEQMFLVSRLVQKPVAMFVDQSDAETMRAAIEAGVSAYIVDGLRGERVKSIVDMAIIRFGAYSKLQNELDKAKTELAERKLVDRAKRLLMANLDLSENDAYARLRRSAMDGNKRIGEVAQTIIDMMETPK